MTVTKIEAVNNKKCRIYIDEEFAFALYSSEIRSYELKEGEQISTKTYEEIVGELLPQRAKSRMLYLLQTMDRTEGQVRLKLQRDGYPEPVIDSAVDYAREYHYIDDERYISNYLQTKSGTKSRQQIRAELLAKGISPEQLRNVWEQQDLADERNAITWWMEKKKIDATCASREQLIKFCQFMMRKGFRYEDIQKELSVCSLEPED